MHASANRGISVHFVLSRLIRPSSADSSSPQLRERIAFAACKSRWQGPSWQEEGEIKRVPLSTPRSIDRNHIEQL